MWKGGKGGAHTGMSRDEWARSWSTLWRASELMRQPELQCAELRSPEPDLERR